MRILPVLLACLAAPAFSTDYRAFQPEWMKMRDCSIDAHYTPATSTLHIGSTAIKAVPSQVNADGVATFKLTGKLGTLNITGLSVLATNAGVRWVRLDVASSIGNTKAVLEGAWGPNYFSRSVPDGPDASSDIVFLGVGAGRPPFAELAASPSWKNRTSVTCTYSK
jgi:hypothetical protein